MNNAEQYVYEVYKAGSFSKAAKKLFVSQPALSSTVKKLEIKLGYEIFNRKTSPITLTNEGQIYINYLVDSIELEKQYKSRLRLLKHNNDKTINIGGSNSASAIIIPELCREFSIKCPDIGINIDIGETSQFNNLVDKLDKGLLDVVITSDVTSAKYECINLWKEKYYIVIRKDYPGVAGLKDHFLTYDEVYKGIYPKEKKLTKSDFFDNICIFKPGSNRKGGEIAKSFFKENGTTKYKIQNFRKTDMHHSLMLAGLGAAFLPGSNIIQKGFDEEKICCFAINSENNTRRVMLVYKKNIPLSPQLKELIKIAKNMFTNNIT